MNTKFELTEADLKKIIAEKFGATTDAVKFDMVFSKADRPYESDTKILSATVTLKNTEMGSVKVTSY